MSISNAALRNPAGDYSCDDLPPIFSDRELYILLEYFCNQVTVTQSSYESFLQHYFNDSGHVDIWRILHAMIDVLLHRTQYNRAFESRDFRETFHRFVRDLLVLCMEECHRNTLVSPLAASGQMEVTDLQSDRREYINALTTSFTKVLEILASEEY